MFRIRPDVRSVNHVFEKVKTAESSRIRVTQKGYPEGSRGLAVIGQGDFPVIKFFAFGKFPA